MNATLCATGALLLCACATAQTYVISPPGLGGKEGNAHRTDPFGSFTEVRLMLFDGELRGTSATLKEVAYRHDAAWAYQSYGRSWTNVTLSISDCDVDNLTETFTGNPTSTPTRVFAGAVTWPEVLGPPPVQPAPWSIRFPFATNWAYDGKKDVCLDYAFQGGALKNAQPWTGLTPYFLDAAHPEAQDGPWTFFGKTLYFGGCVDSVYTFPMGGFMYLAGESFMATNHTPPLHRIVSSSELTAPLAPVIHLLGIAGNPAGVLFPGVTCNRLYLDATKPFTFLIAMTMADGSTDNVHPTGTPNGVIPYSPATSGLTIWGQAAWDDSKTGALRLTNAVKTQIPPMPVRAKQDFLFATSLSAKVGTGLWKELVGNPICRYRL